ncbi:hypothetical protein [Clostridium sp.]|uniref:hypothetical protein n=1 Tax=Clostridium sp. TaxID=1506 RepID=UPI002608A34E|nr:hypothetical protein [Clostridium sp.]
MDIQKEKIVEIFDKESNKVVRYRQVIKNNTINEITEIETDNLKNLITEVRKQVNEWNKLT